MRTVLVTGAARGIGAACGEAFEQIGDRVIRTDIEDTDLTKREQVERLFGSLQSLDVLVANAGVLYSKTTLDASDEDWQSCLDVNLRSVWWCARAAHPLLKKSGNGAIITIASAQGVRSGKSSFPYSAAKGGLLALTRSMAVEYAPRVRVNAIIPGQIESVRTEPYFAQFPDPAKARKRVVQTFPMGRLGKPEDIAKAVRFLASEDASWITGTHLYVDGGRDAALPDFSDLKES
jgi:NAD(P)-dependent dehydrogenase (short-subunit alcohol dehydrogenase family)